MSNSNQTNVGVDVFGDPPQEHEMVFPVLVTFTVTRCPECDEFLLHGSDDHCAIEGHYDYGLRRRHRWHVHPECVLSCEWCGDAFVTADVEDHWSYGHEGIHGLDICHGCRDDYLVTCESCDCVMHQEDSSRLGDYAYCNDCHAEVASYCDACDDYHHVDDDPCEEAHGHSDLVRNYSYKPNPMFRWVTDGVVQRTDYYTRDDRHMTSTPFFGFELEIEACGNSIVDGAELFHRGIDDNVLYLKEDGSLNNGFEIVTHPATLDYYQNHFDWSAFRSVKDMGYKSWGERSCGFHIHISRSAFMRRSSVANRDGVFSDYFLRRTGVTPHLMAFMYFIYKNTAQVERIAGRNSSYGRLTTGEISNLMSYCRFGNSGDRYMAVNVNNSSTIELRMFRGSLKVERILGYIQFADALYNYTSESRVSKMHDQFSFLGFAQWVGLQPKYDDLTRLINVSGALNV